MLPGKVENLNYKKNPSWLQQWTKISGISEIQNVENPYLKTNEQVDLANEPEV